MGHWSRELDPMTLRYWLQDDSGVFGDKGAIRPLPPQFLNDDLLSGCHQPDTTTNAHLCLPPGSFRIEDSESTSFSSITDSWRPEPIKSSLAWLDSFGNLAVQHSAPNLKRMVDVTRSPIANVVDFESGCHQPDTTTNARLCLPPGSFSIEDSESTSFSSITDSWRPEPINSSLACLDSFGNLAVQHSAPNLKRMVGVTRSPIANVVDFESGLQCNSGFMIPTFPELDPDSWINGFNKDQEDPENLKKQEVHMSNFQAMKNSASPISRLSDPPNFFSFYNDRDDEFPGRELKLIIRKELTKSDVRRVGRIVIPKKDAEANLPTLSESEAKILHMNDTTLEVTWKFRYRFWSNNKSRMYIMETTGEFVKAHELQRGDLFIIYQNTKSGDYIVEGKKVMQPRESCNFRDGSTVSRDWHTQLPGD